MRNIRVSLEQWKTLLAVIEHGGFAQAAEVLHRSQSSVSYTVTKLQQQLGLPLLRMSGRKAVLNEAGQVLLHRARLLLQEAGALEEMAHQLQAGREAEVNLVVDAALPQDILFSALRRFAERDQGTRVQLREVILSGADEALISGEADLAVGAQIPKGFLGDKLIEIEFIAVAHPEHPLHQRPAPLSLHDLRTSMQVVIRDSGLLQPQDVGWLDSESRWTVTSIETAVHAIKQGLGFGWIPQHHICEALQQGTLKPLPLESGQTYNASLYLIYGKESPGPATRQLAEGLKEAVGF